ncbi:hypothetical protein NUW54_g11161 [Trametes sanguinea]|uniref:Uncharacterized protein n=1 Tax=Trametes sanguinea TaxID=158606 RepID=A0ACC1NLQ8_9APHY|nr:hypothetical protein NUW54_g11161 [Trametes sanguinea]
MPPRQAGPATTTQPTADPGTATYYAAQPLTHRGAHARAWHLARKAKLALERQGDGIRSRRCFRLGQDGRPDKAVDADQALFGFPHTYYNHARPPQLPRLMATIVQKPQRSAAHTPPAHVQSSRRASSLGSAAGPYRRAPTLLPSPSRTYARDTAVQNGTPATSSCRYGGLTGAPPAATSSAVRADAVTDAVQATPPLHTMIYKEQSSPVPPFCLGKRRVDVDLLREPRFSAVTVLRQVRLRRNLSLPEPERRPRSPTSNSWRRSGSWSNYSRCPWIALQRRYWTVPEVATGHAQCRARTSADSSRRSSTSERNPSTSASSLARVLLLNGVRGGTPSELLLGVGEKDILYLMRTIPRREASCEWNDRKMSSPMLWVLRYMGAIRGLSPTKRGTILLTWAMPELQSPREEHIH